MFTLYRIARGGGGEGGGCFHYISHIGMCDPKGGGFWFLCRFGLKTGIDFAYLGLESGMVFEKTTGGYESIYHRFQFQMNKKERVLL